MRTQPDFIIRQLENHNSRLDKEAILEDAIDEGLTEFFVGLRLALNPLVVFGIKQVPLKEDAAGQGLPWDAFMKLQGQLASRELTGHAARDAVQLACDVATKEQWNDWYRRILQKDLKCGVSDKTVNKVCKRKGVEHLGVPVFSCQLAHDAANHEKKLTGKKQVEVKLDGVRVLTVITQDASELGWKIEMFSRNGKRFENFGHIEREIEAVIRRSPPPYALILDGEVMSANFQDLMKQVHRKDNVAAGDAVLHLFDTVPYNEWRNGGWDKPQQFRSEITRHWVRDNSDLLAHVQALDW
jgi:DNA ligase-1